MILGLLMTLLIASPVPFVREEGASQYPEGLSGTHIALWTGHGRTWYEEEHRWKWQRAPVHRTVEDLYTRSYVLDMLIPMLENAGAYVLTPRERCLSQFEAIADADSSFAGERSGSLRRRGGYSEKGAWTDAGEGFADLKEAYDTLENPFTMGRARRTPCAKSKEPTALARWTAEFPQKGEYPVYVSYRTLKESSGCAHYTVEHAGGTSSFIVDQRIGGGTWIYLGTFSFEGSGAVTLDNGTPDGYKYRKSAVSADAVRFGGGMGKVLREGTTSGLPAACEAGLYNLQWAGADSTILCTKENDYLNDIVSKGLWANWLRNVKGIPLDLSFAFHTDAGTMQADSLRGTLTIYTDTKLSKPLAEIVQTRIAEDVSAVYGIQWPCAEPSRRKYAETRIPEMPAIILELLSHQNLSDMVYGHDPEFRFVACRAVYKGILEYIGKRDNRQYAVQPLPVRNFSVGFSPDSTKALLSWAARADLLEPSAVAKRYVVSTRIDSSAFDSGITVTGTSVEMSIERGHVYSYRIVAEGDGGRSFPSETLCIALPESSEGPAFKIVNAFTEIGAPAWFRTDEAGGFLPHEDGGIPYMRDITFVGENYDFDRSHLWINDDEAGFGASWQTAYGKPVAGNSFDFPYLHAKVLMRLGRASCSQSAGAFEESPVGEYLDIICGKQRAIFSAAMANAVRQSRRTVISGAFLGTAAKTDSTGTAEALGIKWATSHASPDGLVGGGMRINRTPGPRIYVVENPDGIVPATKDGKSALKYDTSRISAAVFHSAEGRKTASFGFPLEAMVKEDDIRKIFEKTLDYFAK